MDRSNSRWPNTLLVLTNTQSYENDHKGKQTETKSDVSRHLPFPTQPVLPKFGRPPLVHDKLVRLVSSFRDAVAPDLRRLNCREGACTHAIRER